ncbi:hypothetical protein WBG78_08870 [Chryseolinea sp. T2]|uniref:hypothetical protein n=1 Tax=Chryseolinea sp. T2 TaxID=3129255 RepID=UPI003078689B
MILRLAKALLMATVLLSAVCAHGDTVISLKNGYWDDPSVWDAGVAPGAASAVVINHQVSIRSLSSVEVQAISVAGHLVLEGGALLGLSGADNDTFRFMVTGVVECAEGSSLQGVYASNALFDEGSRYVHRQGPLGFIPIATWRVSSTFQISGFTDDGYINLAHSTSWHQAFGNVEYDCPNQTVFIVDLNGHLRDIRGNFIIRNTNNKALRLCTTQQTTINIAKNLIIEGPTQLWFTTNSPNVTVNIGGDFQYRSESTSGSYLSTRGNVKLVVGGSWMIDSRSVLRMASSVADSTGSRQSWVSVAGNFQVVRGGLVAPPAGSGRGTIEFNGNVLQRVDIAPIANPLVGNIEYMITDLARVSLGESAITSDQGALTVQGILEVGSTDASGAIQLGRNGGNIRIPGPRHFTAQSTVIYNGSDRQVIGTAHPSMAHTVLSNEAGVMQVADVTVMNDFALERGTFDQAGHTLIVNGNFTLRPPHTRLEGVRLSGAGRQTIDANGASIDRLELFKTGGRAEMTSPLMIAKKIDVGPGNNILASNGYLTLLSLGDGAGQTAAIGALGAGSSIEGDVTVQRFMSGEGRLYRYLSSPVSNGSVGSVMDDFPVTGRFLDPSSGPGISTFNPSFFEYDETYGEKLAGWREYPRGGRAAEAPLVIGRGYAAFIRNTSSTIVDFVGPINQHDITIPFTYTLHSGRANGWNLVGNPYPSSISWESPSLIKNGLSHVIVITDNGDHRFRYWDGDAQFTDIPEGRIALGQSFWVRAMSADASLTFREEAKTDDAAFYRRPAVQVPSLCLKVSSARHSDRLIVRLRKQSKESLDAWDGVKLLNDTLNISLLSPDGLELAIDSRPALPDSISIHLSGLNEGAYQFDVSWADLSFLTCLLRDDYLGRMDKLTPDHPIKFTVSPDPSSRRADRFTLLLIDSIARADQPSPATDTTLLSIDKRDQEHPFRIHSLISQHEYTPENKELCIKAYPNPVVKEMTVQVCCGACSIGSSREGNSEFWRGSGTANNRPVIESGKGRLTESFSFEIYNAPGMRVEPRLFCMEIPQARGVQRKDTNDRCAVCVLSLELLPPGTYQLAVRCFGKTQWVRFVKI